MMKTNNLMYKKISPKEYAQKLKEEYRKHPEKWYESIMPARAATELIETNIGIPFLIPNNFYGNKLFYPALNSHQRTVKYVFGRLPWLKPNFFSVKTRSAVKSVFLNDFRQARTKLY